MFQVDYDEAEVENAGIEKCTNDVKSPEGESTRRSHDKVLNKQVMGQLLSDSWDPSPVGRSPVEPGSTLTWNNPGRSVVCWYFG